jgi:hypothetical protein
LDWIARDTIARNTEATLLMLKAQIESAPEDGTRETMGLLHRPAFVTMIVVFLALAAILSLAVGGALVAPHSPLSMMWRMNPHAQLGFAALGALGVALMIALAALASLVALGLWVGTRWGWWLAVIGLVLNAIGDLVHTLTLEPRAAIGIPVVAAVLLLLTRTNVRRWCSLDWGSAS